MKTIAFGHDGGGDSGGWVVPRVGARADDQSHVISGVKEAQWGPAPPMLPAGAQIAVLAGDPTASSAYTVRLKFPANYAIPRTRTQPTSTSSSFGALTFGMGEKLAKGAAGQQDALGRRLRADAGRHESLRLYGRGDDDRPLRPGPRRVQVREPVRRSAREEDHTVRSPQRSAAPALRLSRSRALSRLRDMRNDQLKAALAALVVVCTFLSRWCTAPRIAARM